MGGLFGRRGATSVMYEIIISLVMLALFTLTVWMYIGSHANGEAYIARFYAADLATSAEVVNSGYGDVLLRYDNVKQNMQHTFWLANGVVNVGKTGGDATLPLGTGFYGQATRFDGDNIIVSPNYLVLRKASGFSINSLEKANIACPMVADKKVPYASAVLYVDDKDVRNAVTTAMQGTSISVVDTPDKANIRVTIKKPTGDQNTIVFAPTSPDGASLACLFQQQLAALSTIGFTANAPSSSPGDFALDITLTTRQDVKLTADQIGQAIWHALAVFYQGQTATAVAVVTPPPGTTPSASSGDIVLLGDSLTVGYSPFVGKTCAGRQVRVDAVSGSAGYEMLSRLNNDLANKPGTVVILAGVNDITKRGDNTQKLETTLTQLESTVKQQAPQAQVIFITLVPWKGYPSWSANYETTTDSVNSWLLGKGAINVNAALDANSDQIQDPQFCQKKADGTCDMLHLNPQGYQLMANMVKQRLGCANG